MSRLVALVALTLTLGLAAGGCASIAPGLHLFEDQVGEHSTDEHRVELTAITAALLVEQARARRAVTRAIDANEARVASYEYEVAPLDVLSVTVWDHPELTIPAGEFRAADLAGNPVLADGSLFYPHVGVVQVAGKTVAEIRELLTKRLQGAIEKPQLDVRVVAFRGKRAQVTGEVVQPTALAIGDVPLRVQDAIAQARGLTQDAWTRDVTLTRGTQVVRLDLQAFYEDGDLTQNWLLEPGDVLHVPSRQQYKVFVLGEVRAPSSKLMPKGRMTLADAIGDAAGFDPLTSDTGEVYVLRGGDAETPQVFKLDATSADALLLAVQFRLEPLDVIYVAPYVLTDWNRTITQLLPTVQGLWQTIDLANRAANATWGVGQ